MIRWRKRAYRKARKTMSYFHWNKFRHIRNEVVSCIRKSKDEYMDKLTTKLKSESKSSKQWWSTLKTLLYTDTVHEIPPLQNNGQNIDDNMEKANLFNKYFQQQTSIDDTGHDLPVLPESENVLSSITLSSQDINDVLRNLKTGKAVGPDLINNHVLRELSHEIAEPLCALFNRSLSLGIVPSSWKCANVCTIFKAGDRSLVSNYRPVSLLCSLEKVFEKCIFKHVYNFFHTNNTISRLQSGFKPKGLHG